MGWTRGRTIGRGSTATVSIATADQSGHVFAVKSSEFSKSEFLIKEQKILSNLNCPQVVTYRGFDISSENGNLMYNLFLEYVPSGSITDMIHNHGGGLDESMIRSYTRGILLGLEFLHSNGIVHCDIKGQNILVLDNGGVKIADLGCARLADVEGCIAGTPVYMAPEVARGEQQGFPADVWALGCTVIEMATGRSPWPEAGDAVTALFRIGFSSDLPEIPSNVSIQARDFLSKCLRRDPVERWSVKELLAHEFMKGSKSISKKSDCSKIDTPNSVLHQQQWDSIQGLETIQNPSRKMNVSNSLIERIRELGQEDSSSNLPNWESDEDWITVRSNTVEDDVNFSQAEETMNDYELAIEYNPKTISGKTIDNSSSNSRCDESRYRIDSSVLCEHVTYFLCIKLNLINDKFYFNKMHMNLKSNTELLIK